LTIIALLVVTLIAYVHNHARLQNILPWNPNYSKTSPCGGAPQPTKPAATLVTGDTVTFQWQIIAGDGVGAVTAQIDPNGGTTFVTPLTLTGPTPTTVGTYTFTATVPAITCTGASSDGSKLCTIQLQSSSGWYSCTSVQILATGEQSVAIPTVCVYPSTLGFCSSSNNQNVVVPDSGQDLGSYDQALQSTFTITLNNPAVFTTNTTACAFYYKKLFCGINYPLCAAPSSGGCQQACNNVRTFCNVTALHSNLFNCNNYPNTNADSTGSCALMYNSSFRVVSSYMILFVLIIFYLI